MLKLKIHRFIRPLKKKWLEIEKESDQSPYQSYFIQRIVAARHPINMIRKKCVPAYCEIIEDGKTVMIAPIYRKIAAKGVITSYIGLTGFNIYDFIYGRNVSVEKMKEYIGFMFKELKIRNAVFDDVPTDSVTYKALSEMNGAEYSIYVNANQNVNIFIGSNYDEYYNALSKHTRQNIRTAYNRLNKDGKQYRFECIRGKRIKRSYLNKLLQVYLSRRESKYEAEESVLREMYMKYLDFSTAYQQKWKDNIYCVLHIDGKVASFMSGIVCGNGETAIFPRLAINDEFAKYSPGCLLINEAAKELIRNSEIKNIDLSKGAEQYKFTMGGEAYCSQKLTVKRNAE